MILMPAIPFSNGRPTPLLMQITASLAVLLALPGWLDFLDNYRPPFMSNIRKLSRNYLLLEDFPKPLFLSSHYRSYKKESVD
jgi:hypothetical protein